MRLLLLIFNFLLVRCAIPKCSQVQIKITKYAETPMWYNLYKSHCFGYVGMKLLIIGGEKSTKCWLSVNICDKFIVFKTNFNI